MSIANVRAAADMGRFESAKRNELGKKNVIFVDEKGDNWNSSISAGHKS
jgi:hypothetical protein